MSYKITYRYFNYPDSKVATLYSRVAGFIVSIVGIVGFAALLAVATAIFYWFRGDGWDPFFIYILLLLIGCIVYWILHFKVIIPLIDKVAGIEHQKAAKVKIMTEEERHEAAMKALNERMRNRYK